MQKYGKESCWELTICVLQQTSINNDQIIWCLCVLAMGDLFSDCHSKLRHYRVRDYSMQASEQWGQAFYETVFAFAY